MSQSTTLSEKVALRPSMSEFCSVLCGPFLDMLGITGNTSWESVKCVIHRFPKTLLSLLSPPTPGCRNTGTVDKFMQIEREENHGDEAIRADGYMDNSLLRSELTTYPQPLTERLAQTDRAISSRVTHKQPPSDLCFADPPGNCSWITPRKSVCN